MSKYFAKWLPVEGEIKEGDNIKSTISTDNKIYKVGKTGIAKESALQKVKLFLCSKDIKVGDIIWSEETGKLKEYTYTKSLDFDILPTSYSGKLSNKAFKVVGEISPEAKWVKEGDEFNEDNISGYAAFQGNFNDFTTYLLDTPEESVKDSYIKIFKIKCPCCNKFC